MRSIFVSTVLRVGIVLLPVLLLSPGVSAAEIAGRLQFVVGDVSLVNPDGASRVASKGGEIAEGESIATGKNAQAQILMSDQALIAVRSDTLLKIETYRYSGKENENDRSFLGLLRGGFRAVTGQIGRFNRSAYQVRTPNATIGIRGTDHEPFYIPPPLPGQTPLGTPGTYDKVNSGATVLQTQGGRVELGPNQVGFVAQQLGAMPQKLPETPSFMRNSTLVPQAAPQPSAVSARAAGTEDARPSGDAEQKKSGQTTVVAQGKAQGTASQGAVVQGDMQKSAAQFRDVSPASDAPLINPSIPPGAAAGSGPPIIRAVTGNVKGAGREFHIDASKIDTTQGGKVCTYVSGGVQIVVNCRD